MKVNGKATRQAARAQRSALEQCSRALEPTATKEVARTAGELERGAVAFGDFVERVGLAVADAQTRLDENMVSNAERLAKTTVDVVSVFEQTVDDDGVVSQGTAHVQRLPITSFLMPKPYAWSKVALDAQLTVSGFSREDGFRIDTTPGRPGIASLPGTTTSGSSSVQTESSVGTMRLSAILEPRAEVQPSSPLLVQRAPRIRLVAGEASDILADGRVVGRQLVVPVELTRSNGTPIGNKMLSFQIADFSISWTAGNEGRTGAEGTSEAGRVTLLLKREGAAFDAAGRVPQPVQVRVWLGIVTEAAIVAV